MLINFALETAETIVVMAIGGAVVYLFLPILKDYPIWVSVAIGCIIGMILAKPLDNIVRKFKR